MRLDKFLKVSRVIKRRTLAKEAAQLGRIEVGGRTAKPGTDLKIGDIVTVHFGSSDMSFRVLSLSETVRKEDAAGMYEIV